MIMRKNKIKSLNLFIGLLVVMQFSLMLSPNIFGKDYRVDATEEANPYYTEITSFEDLKDFYNFSLDGSAKLTINSDKKYVTNGEKSLKVESWGKFLSTSQNRLYIPLCKNGAYMNLSKLKGIEFDLYNTLSTEKMIGVALLIDGYQTDFVYYKAKVGDNAVKVSFDIPGLSVACDLTKGEKVILDIPVAKNIEEATNNIFYFDDLGAAFSIKTPEYYTIEFDEGEICSFEKDFQAYVYTKGSVGPAKDCEVLMSINTDSAYCSDGLKSLKVELPTGTPPLNDGWPVFGFIEKIIKSFNYTALADAGKSIEFDIYNTGSQFSLRFETFTGTLPVGNNYYFWNTRDSSCTGYSKTLTCNPGWNHFSIKISDWNGAGTGSEEIPNKTTDLIRTWHFVYDKFSSENKVLYFDDFKLV